MSFQSQPCLSYPNFNYDALSVFTLVSSSHHFSSFSLVCLFALIYIFPLPDSSPYQEFETKVFFIFSNSTSLHAFVIPIPELLC